MRTSCWLSLLFMVRAGSPGKGLGCQFRRSAGLGTFLLIPALAFDCKRIAIEIEKQFSLIVEFFWVIG